MKLSELQTGQTGIVLKIHGHGAFRKRVIEMGFVKGHAVKVLLHAPLKDPINYSILGYEISLRRAEADLIEVVAVDDAEVAAIGSEVLMTPPPEIAATEAHRSFDRQRHIINIALIGNPNCGKTSIFNAASGAREHVGNYSGVTVDAKGRQFHFENYKFNIVDLPGTYSLTCYSPEELYVRQYLRENTPDVIVNVVDSSNLERNLFLTTELIDMDVPMVIALNMYDELRASGARLDYEALGKMIGVPMVPVVSKTGEGAVRKLVDAIKAAPAMRKHFSPRYLAIKLLEGDHEIEDEIPAVNKADKQTHKPGFLEKLTGHSPHDKALWRQHVHDGADDPIMLLRDKLRAKIETLHDQDISSIVAAEKYGFVAGALAETYTPGHKQKGRASAMLDKLATNRWLGFPIFFAIMIFIFWATFAIGNYPMEWIEDGVAWLAEIVQKLMPDGPLKDLVADGRCYRLSAQHLDTLLLHIVYGRLGLYGACGVYHGQGDAPHRPARQVVHPPGHGFRLQCAGHSRIAQHREQVEPHHHRTHQPVYVVLGPTAYLRAAVRHFLCRLWRPGHGRALLRGDSRGGNHGATAAALPV